jgi:hypothetical protein
MIPAAAETVPSYAETIPAQAEMIPTRAGNIPACRRTISRHCETVFYEENSQKNKNLYCLE